MSRSALTVTVDCDQCHKEEVFEIPKRSLRFWQSHLSDVLFDMNWVVDTAKGLEFCPSCCPPDKEEKQ